jgi:hypothetical protein
MGKNGFFMVNDERLGTFFIFIKKGGRSMLHTPPKRNARKIHK